MLLGDTIFAVLISTQESDIKNYEREVGFYNKEKGILVNKLDEKIGIDYTRFFTPLKDRYK